jgi:hypothetical protein
MRTLVANRAALKTLLGALRSEAWILSGSAGAGMATAKLFFLGSIQQKAHLARMFFGDSCDEVSLGKLDLLRAMIRIHFNLDKCDVALIEGGEVHRRLYQGAHDFFIPIWLKSKVELPLLPMSSSAKDDWRRARRAHLSYHVTTEAEALLEFYRAMYLPTIAARHGDSAIPIDERAMMLAVRNKRCELLVVSRAETNIAGALLLRDSIPRIWANGIRDADPRLWKEGAIAATYMFSAQHLAAQGYKQMHMGMSRAFLNDGVLRYKTKWKHRIIGFDTNGFILKMLRISAGTRALLAANPFVHVDQDGLKGAVFVASDVVEAPDASQRTLSDLSVDGLAGMNLYSVRQGGLTRLVPRAASSGHVPARAGVVA